jgi:hypothetical protein
MWEKGAEWPEPRFTDHGNGTVTDNLTGLIWMKNANCFFPDYEMLSWNQALSLCNGLESGECGLTDSSDPGDWRLPNVKEYQSLIDYGRNNPALPSGHPFNNVSNQYWSSTTVMDSLDYAWLVRMFSGSTEADGVKLASFMANAWCVKGGH